MGLNPHKAQRRPLRRKIGTARDGLPLHPACHRNATFRGVAVATFFVRAGGDDKAGPDCVGHSAAGRSTAAKRVIRGSCARMPRLRATGNDSTPAALPDTDAALLQHVAIAWMHPQHLPLARLPAANELFLLASRSAPAENRGYPVQVVE